MLRTPLLWASTNPFLAERLPRYRFVRRAVRRFMPGEEPEDALAEAARLNRMGAGATITLLGENVASRTEADGVVAHYRGVLERVRRDRLDVEISVKPTQLGMDLGLGVAKANLRMLVADAADDGTMVWVDMEAAPYVDRTLELFRSALAVGDHVGVCLQAYLYRTEEDIERLMPLRSASSKEPTGSPPPWRTRPKPRWTWRSDVSPTGC